MAESCPNLNIFCTLKHLKVRFILETLFYKSLNFKYSQCILRAPVYILTLKQTLLVIDVLLVRKIQLTGNAQLLPSS